MIPIHRLQPAQQIVLSLPASRSDCERLSSALSPCPSMVADLPHGAVHACRGRPMNAASWPRPTLTQRSSRLSVATMHMHCGLRVPQIGITTATMQSPARAVSFFVLLTPTRVRCMAPARPLALVGRLHVLGLRLSASRCLLKWRLYADLTLARRGCISASAYPARHGRLHV